MAVLQPSGELTGVFIIDGTHSSGKSTVIEDYFGDKPLITDDYIGLDGAVSGHQYPFSCVAEIVDDLTVPVVVAREAARQYDRFQPDKRVLTDGFSREDQAGINLIAANHITLAVHMAGAMGRRLQPERRHPVSAVISDRSPISGFVYAETRLPAEDHAVVSISEIAAASGGMILAGRHEPPMHMKQIVNRACRQFDGAFLANYTEIPLEDDGYRLTDLAFRATIDASVRAAYTRIYGPDRVTTLQGNRPERVAVLQQNLRQLLGRLMTI